MLYPGTDSEGLRQEMKIIEGDGHHFRQFGGI